MSKNLSKRIILITTVLLMSLFMLPVLGNSYSVYAANMSADDAIEIEEGTTNLTFRTNSEDETWEQYKWYKFTPEESGWYLWELTDPIYLYSEVNTFIRLYPSYSDAQSGNNYTYRDLEESREKISLVSKLISGQTYYLEIYVSSDYDMDTDYNMSLNIGTTAAPDPKVKFAETEVTYTLGKDDYPFLYLENYGAESWDSQNKDVVEIGYGDWGCAQLELKSPGSSVITATDKDGLSASCTVNVVTPDIIVPKKDILCNIADGSATFEISSGYGLSYKSSNESAVKIGSYCSDSVCELDLIAPGSATITITDPAGKTDKVKVTVGESVWSLNKTSINDVLSEEYCELEITTDDWINEFRATSSNEKVISVENDYGRVTKRLYYEGPGSATITVTDKYGKKATCQVVLKPDSISFGSNAAITFDVYGSGWHAYSDHPEDDEYRLDTKGDNVIASVKSSNSNVVQAKRVKDPSSGYEDYYLSIKPVGAGTAAITATDQFGQTATMQVTVTQKYIDEVRYWDDLSAGEVSGYNGSVVYGDTKLYCWCEIAANIYTNINGEKYTGSVDEDGYYVIRGIPKVPAGTKLTVVFQKGQAVYNETITVQKKQGASLSGSAKAQTYSGKALKPAITIKHGKTILNAGTDYTVKYSNNKKVGKGKATITFKGNYKGAKAVYFKINPKGTTLKVKAIKKGFTAKWKKQSVQTTGYQIQYALNKKFTSGKKTITVKKASTLSKKFTKLKAGKKYYVRIRTFKTVGSKKYYSKWSKIKTITTKK